MAARSCDAQDGESLEDRRRRDIRHAEREEEEAPSDGRRLAGWRWMGLDRTERARRLLACW